jgi:hypothetical protein
MIKMLFAFILFLTPVVFSEEVKPAFKVQLPVIKYNLKNGLTVLLH